MKKYKQRKIENEGSNFDSEKWLESHKIFLYFEMGCIDFYIFQLHFHYRYFCSWIVHKEKLTLVDDTNPNSK